MTFALILNALLDVSKRLKKYMLKEGEVCNEQMDLWEEQRVVTTLLFRVYSFAPLLLQKAIIRAMQLTDVSFRHVCTIAFLIVLLVIDLCWDKKK